MGDLRARLVKPVPSLDGVQADVVLIEPNGDEYLVRCLCRLDGSTEIGGDPVVIAFLNEKYGDQALCGVAREAAMKSLDAP
jgi:hypothetical protein